MTPIEIRHDNRIIRIAARHAVYAPQIGTDFELYWSAVEPNSRENGVEIVDYSRPIRHRVGKVDFWFTSLPEMLPVVEKYLRYARFGSNDLVFDVGAYCGYSSYCFAQRAGKVIAFEPDPESYQVLTKNLQEHNLANVEPCSLAITGTAGETGFYSEGNLGAGLARTVPRAPDAPTMRVTATTLEEACRMFGVPSYIKFNIEGAEVEVLDSSRDLLTRESIDVAIDSNHNLGGELTRRRCEQILTDCGYWVKSSNDGGLAGFWVTWGRK
jgi:FkbM family methyltransferase